MAEGLGGNLILPEASCQACEAATSRVEWMIVRRLFFVPRQRLGLIGKRRRRPDAKITLTTIVEGHDVEIELPLDDHPTLLMLPVFDWPGVVVDRPISIPGFVGFWGQQLVDLKDLVARHPEKATPTIDIVSLCQMVAKITHSYAIATLGEDLFSPLLTSFVLRKFGRLEEYPNAIIWSVAFRNCINPHPVSTRSR